MPEQGVLHPSPSTQGSIQPLVPSPVVVELSKSEYRKLGHLSNVEKDMEISPSDTGAKGTSPSASHSSLATEALVSSSSCQGSQGSLLSTKEAVKDSLSVPDVQKPYPFTTQDLEALVTTQGPLHIYTPSKQNLHSLPSTLGDLPLKRTVEMSSLAQGILEPLISNQGEGTKYQSEKDNLGQSVLIQGTIGPLPPRGAMGLPKSESRTRENLPSEQGSSSYTQGTEKPLLCSPVSVKPSSVPRAQKPPQTTSRTLKIVRCKQRPPEHSMSVQETVGSLPSTPGSPEQSSSFQKKLGHSSQIVAFEDTSPSVQGTTGPLSCPSRPTGHSLYDQGSWESSAVSRDLAHLLSTKLLISAPPTLSLSPYTQQSLQQSSSLKILETSESAQCTHKHLSSVSSSLGMSSCEPRTTGTLPHVPKLVVHSLTTQASPAPPPSLQKSVATSLYPQATREMNASAHISLLPSSSTQVPAEASHYAEATLGRPVAAQGIEEPLLSSSGILDYKECDKQELVIFPSSQVFLGLSLPEKETLGSMSSAQGVLGTSLSTQESLKLSTSKQEPIGTVSSVSKTLKHPAPSQRALKFSPSFQHTLQCSSCSPETTGPVLSSQENPGTFLSSPGYAEHYPSAPGVQVHPLSTPAAVGPSQGPKKNNTAAKGTLPVQRSLTSIQRNREHSSYSTGGLGHYIHTQSTLGHLPCVWEDVESSQSASGSIESLISSHPGEYMGLSELPQKTASSFLSDQGSMGPCLSANESMKVTKSKQVTLESSQSAQGTGGHSLSAQETVGMLPPSPPQSGRHTFSTQGGAETLQPVQGNLAPLKSAQGPLKLSISAQAMIHNLGSAEGALLHSAPSPAVSETNEYSPSTRGTSGTSRYARLHLDLSASLRLTPSSSQSEQGTVGPCLSEEGTLKVTKSKETTLGSSASVQDNGGHTLSGQDTVAKSMSAKQTVGTLPPTPGPLGSTQNTQVLPEPLPSDQRPLEISLSLQGSLGSSSSQEAFRDSCSAQGSLKLSTSKQGTVQTVSSAQKTLQPPTSCQAAMRVSPSVQNAAQRSPSSPRPTGPFLPSQKSQEFFCTSPSDLRHCPPVLGAQEHIVPAPGVLGALLSSQKPKEISRAAEETMPVQSYLFSNQRNLEPSAYSTGILGQPKESQSTLGYLALMREDITSTQSASTTLKNLPTSPPEPGRHSSATQGGAETFPSGQGFLAPLQSTQELLKQSVSGQAKMNTSQCSKGSHNPLGLSSSEQGAQASSESSHGAVGPCLSTQGIVRLSASTQTSTQHTTSAQRLSSPSLHTQVTGTQSTSTKCTVEYSPSTPGCQGYTYPAQKKTGTLKSDQGSLRISATAQGFVEPLPSPEGTLGYSTSAPDAQETSTATPGHVVSDDSPLELLISAQLIPLFSSLRLLDPSLSIEGTLDFSKPTEDTLGPSTSCQGLNESLNSPQRVQQTDPSASDSSGSMHSSTDPMLISLSGQGTLGSVSPALGPLTLSLSVQVNPGPLLSVQEAGGPCLSLQGNLEGCTCTHGEPGISNASPGVLKISSSSTVSLGSSPSDQMNLGVSQPVTLSLSAQGVLGTLTSAQEAMDLSSDTLGSTETLGYVQHDLGLRPPCLGTQRPSQFHQSKLPVLSTTQGPSETSLLFKEPPGPCLEKEALGYSPSDPEDLGLAESAQGILETLPCTQNTLEIPQVTQEIIDPLSPAQDSLRFPTPSSLSSEAEEPLPCVKRSSPQEDISHPISTEEGSKHALIVQEGEKPSISAKREPTALVPFLCGFIPSPVPKGSATSFPVNQGKFRHISQAGDVRSSLSYQGKDKAYEFGYPLCDPSVLGGHKYTHFVRSNLKRIPLQKGRCSSFLSPEGAIRPSQSDQCGLRLSSSHQRDIGYASPVSDSLRMFQAERVGLAKLHLRNWASEILFMTKEDSQILIKSGSDLQVLL